MGANGFEGDAWGGGCVCRCPFLGWYMETILTVKVGRLLLLAWRDSPDPTCTPKIKGLGPNIPIFLNAK